MHKAALILDKKQRSYSKNKILKNLNKVTFKRALLQKREISEFLA